MQVFIAIAAAGAVGAVARYAVYLWSLQRFGDRFPYGTLIVNVLGCLLLGLAAQVGLSFAWMPRALRLAVAVGLLGGFTTFSTFGFETWLHIENDDWSRALLNIAANVVLGIAAVWLGLNAGRAISSLR